MKRTVVGAVIVADGMVLAARRRPPHEHAGRWEFPGGKVEPDEDCRQALVREVREELGVVIRAGAELLGAEGAWPISDRYGLRLYFAGIEAGVPVPGSDHDEVRWLSADELDAVDWLPSDRLALPTLVERLSQ